MIPRRLSLAVSLCLAVALGSGAPAAAAEVVVPEPLRPWVPWVLAKHPDLPCPLVAGARLCGWPGRLVLELDDRGGSFRLEALADRELELGLPGDAARWPAEVADNGRPALLRRAGDRPVVALGPGRHSLQGRFRWTRLPESLPVPPEVGLVEVTVRGRTLAHPRREASGLLWLAAGRGEAAEEEKVALEVSRRIDDGVPVRLIVRLGVRVSGRAREVDLGEPLPAGFVPTALASALPVRLAPAGGSGGGPRLLVQLRPGEWEVVVEARSVAPVAEIRLDERPAPWPREEFWVFQADLAVRSVRLEGAPGVDPQRTPLPEEWRGLPAFRLTPGTTLGLVELRRGQGAPVPDRIAARREWWLAARGDRITSRDALTGELTTGGRLESLAPAELGRVSLGPEAADQVITVGPETGLPGVEVRDGDLGLGADLLYPRGGALPAVGWDRDAQELSIRLNLPPGWTLLAAPGADRAAGGWLDEWTLLDLFFLLLIALATWKLDSLRWGVVAVAVLGASWHEPHAAPLVALWLLLLALKALVRVLAEGRLARWLGALRWAAAVGFALQLVLFCAAQWRTGIFPQLELPASTGPSGAPMSYEREVLSPVYLAAGKEAMALDAPEEVAPTRAPAAAEPKQRLYYLETRARQVDAAAVVQTGPGVPSWGWKRCHLAWSGPVSREQTVRLLLVSPGLERLLSLLRIAGLVLLGLLLLEIRRVGDLRIGRGSGAGPGPSVAAVLWLALLSAPATAAEAPPADLLSELERRLTAPPPCHPECVEVPRLVLAADRGGLRIEAEVHAAAPSAWRLPGPAAAWMPERVTVDGERAIALRGGDDGFLLLRLETGVHRVTMSGAARDSFSLQMAPPPRAMEWRGDGWAITGFRPDAPPPPSVRLDRLLPIEAADGDESGAAAELSPWLELVRELDLGIPWMAHGELRRLGPSDVPVSVRVPLLPGEAVTTAGVTVDGGEAVVTLERGETSRRWRSTLEETPALTLTAPGDRPWMERWVLSCSPIWNCRAEGLAPVRLMEGGAWRPEWRPWPGETLALHFVRPGAAAGPTVTVDSARLAVVPGRRIRDARLDLDLRTSRGSEQTILLPEEATLQSFTVDGRDQPVQLEAGRLGFSVEPGSHRIEAAWRESGNLGLGERSPAVDLGSPAVDVRVDLEVPRNRWLLWAAGPSWGSVVTIWLYLPLLALAAWLLGRAAPAPLSTVDWLLLGVGLTQVPLAAAAVVVLWLVVFGLDTAHESAGKWRSRLRQVFFGLLWLAALAVLYAAVHSGLLGRPEMQIAGPGGGDLLSWYVDRTAGALPRPWVLWLPLWVFRLLMLAWALWLSSRLLRWLPWAWRRFTAGAAAAAPKEPPRTEG